MSARLNTFVFTLLAAITLAGCGEKNPAVADKKGKESPAIPVIVATVTEQSVPLKIQAIGNVEVQATVSIKLRLDGQIVKVGFSDGQDVAKGQLLFEIDARPLQAQLEQAQATLARDKAQLERARAQEER
jgi:multidrug efflux system membrane fusion protein